jgi:polyisoprenoid-binding protein YceI
MFEPGSSFRRALVAVVTTSLVLTAPLMLAAGAQAEETTYEIDRAHSSITFKIKHMFSKVPGRFKQFEGTIAIDPEKRENVNVAASIDVASIDTDEAKRDAHLKGPDFFDTEKFPTITFKGSTLSDVNADRTRGKLTGDLTMRGITKPVVLDVEWFGKGKDPWGNEKIAVAGTTKLNRKDYGIIWNKTLDAGGYLVGDEVEIEIQIEAQLPKTR